VTAQTSDCNGKAGLLRAASGTTSRVVHARRYVVVAVVAVLLALMGGLPTGISAAAATSIFISEVHPAGSGNGSYAADWFEVTNTGTSPVDITNWKMDDDSSSLANAVALRGLTTIPAGRSAVFIEGSADGFSDTTIIANFSTAWFGSPTLPPGLLVGTYGGAGVGLSTSGDAVNLFDAAGNRVTGVRFGAAPAGSPLITFDNTSGLGSTTALFPTVSTASVVGVNGAFLAFNGAEIGSPGKRINASPLSTLDLSLYVRVGRFDLPEPTRTTAPPNSRLAQEVSAVTYDWDTDTLFVVGDGGTSVVQVSKTGQLIDSMTLAPGSSPQGTDFYDPEGLTYVGGGRFVMIEERDRQAVLFTYAAGATLTRSAAQTVKLGTFADNIGIEGISYDPLTGGFIAVKETQPEGIFQTDIDFAMGTATNGSPTTLNSINLFDPALANLLDFADVFALSNLPSLSGADSSHLLVLSQESGKIVNISRSGVVANSLTIVSDPGNPLSVSGQQHEGLTMDGNGVLYVVSENGGGDINHPQLWVYASSSVPNQAPTAVVLINQVMSIAENTNTATRIKVADVGITDDGLGTNLLTLTGPDASFFEADDSGLYIKAGTALDYETKTSYGVTINVDDTTVGGTPDASAPFVLAVTDVVNENPSLSSLIISEVAPWGSGNSPYAADWFEVTNTGGLPVVISGWRMDDNSNSFGSSVALRRVLTIPPGRSVVFLEGDPSGVTDAAIVAAFSMAWFGSATPPSGFLVGAYGGSGVGLSTAGDAVNLFDAAGNRLTGIGFGASTTGVTFDNSAGLGSTTLPLPIVSASSIAGIHGAFLSFDGAETGSPGSTASVPGSVQLTRSGYVRDRRTGTYVQQLTLTNTSAVGLQGPFFVALENVSANASLTNASGTTTALPPLGSPYVLVPGSSGGLSAGASLNVVVQFDNPTNSAITYSPRVVNGVAAP
jgi:uncharacterized protein YjiK